MSIEDQILQALARGYTHQSNVQKVLDADLILAMQTELMPLISRASPSPLDPEGGARQLTPGGPATFQMYDGQKGTNT